MFIEQIYGELSVFQALVYALGIQKRTTETKISALIDFIFW